MMETALTIFKNAIIWLTNSLENVCSRLVLDRDLSDEFQGIASRTILRASSRIDIDAQAKASPIQLYQPRPHYEEMEFAPPDWTKNPPDERLED